MRQEAEQAFSELCRRAGGVVRLHDPFKLATGGSRGDSLLACTHGTNPLFGIAGPFSTRVIVFKGFDITHLNAAQLGRALAEQLPFEEEQRQAQPSPPPPPPEDVRFSRGIENPEPAPPRGNAAVPSAPVGDERQAMEDQTQRQLHRMCVEPCIAEWQACTKRFYDDPAQINRCNATQNACSARCDAMHYRR
jgi:hypothetical protein